MDVTTARPRLADLEIRNLVRTMGGPRAVGQNLGIVAEAVTMWAKSPQGIPAKHHLALWRMAVEHGLSWQPPGSEGWRLVRDDAVAASADDAAPQEFAQCSHLAPVRKAA